MPFTLAHPAAAFPIWKASRRRLRLAALVLGSTAPDFDRVFQRHPFIRFGHSLAGLFLFCVPIGLLCLWLFDRWGRRGVELLLPREWNLGDAPPRAESLLAPSVAVLVGAASHIAWDGLTHPSGWAVRLFPQLASSVQIGPRVFAWYSVLQHASTIVGLVVVTIVCWRWSRSQPRARPTHLIFRIFFIGAVLAVAAVLAGLPFLSRGYEPFLIAGGVAVCVTLGVGLVLLGAIGTRQARTAGLDAER